MGDPIRQRWIGMAILAGVLYYIAGVATAALAGAAATSQQQFFWRLSAFVISGVVFAAHIAHEHFLQRHSARTTAWHTSVGAAFGGFALALSANLHDLGSATGYRPRMMIALLAWPLLTGVPAFVAALLVAAGLGMIRPRR